MWWKNVVRIRSALSTGTGVFIGPDRILTAAHVLRNAPGGSISVEQMHDSHLILDVLDMRFCSAWGSAPSVHDLCALRVPAVFGAGLRTRRDYGLDGMRHSVAAYGYAGFAELGGGEAMYQTGSVRRRGGSFSSEELSAPVGVCGAPLLIDNHGAIEIVGVITAHASAPSHDLTIGPALNTDVYGILLS